MLQFELATGLKGKIKFSEEDRIEFDRLRSFFRTENKSTIFAKQYRYAANPYIYCISPLGNFNIGQTFELVEKCKEMGIETEISNELLEQIAPDLCINEIQQVPNPQFVYRDYQERLLQSLANAGRGVIVSPTRSGKSLILAGLCHNILLNSAKNNIDNILIIVPNCQLVKQFVDDLTEYGLPDLWHLVNFSSDQDKKNKKKKVDFTFEEKNIIISNSQWLLLHGDTLPYIDCIIQDEIHVVKKSSELSKLVRGVKIPFKFGCTGTLPKETVDKWNITGIFGPVLDEIKIKELQDKNVLADVSINPIKFVHSLKQNFRKPKKQSGDDEIFDAFEAAQAEYKNESMFLSQYEPTNKIITKIATGVVEKNPNWNALILFDYTLSGESLFQLLDWDDKHYIDGTVNLDVRSDIVTKMNNPDGGHITVANCKCFGTGITVKNIQCIILVTNQSSVTKVIQAIGRGLRIEDKPVLTVIDVFHSYKYSEKHFKERTELYKEFYGKEQNKDYKIKFINI